MFGQNTFGDEIIDPAARFKADYDRWFLLSPLVAADGKQRNVDYSSSLFLAFFLHVSFHSWSTTFLRDQTCGALVDL